MCCFSGPVENVENTRIFARRLKEGRQLLVYSMRVSAAKEVAMILPLPVKTPAKEDDVKFIDLKEYPKFFDELESGFPKPKPKPTRGPALGGIGALPAAALPVVEVGDFIASFVPTLADFTRVDERFRLGKDVWNKLPAYRDYGFAVFQLKIGAQDADPQGPPGLPGPGRPASEKDFHPMAFEFTSRSKVLFFPTVHIHDGQVHAKADFHHTLYCQSDRVPMNWQESALPAGMFLTKIKQFPSLLDADEHAYKLGLHGELRNTDVTV